jgi:hypothetical protein
VSLTQSPVSPASWLNLFSIASDAGITPHYFIPVIWIKEFVTVAQQSHLEGQENYLTKSLKI